MVFLYHNRKYWRGDLHPEILRLVNEFHTGVTLFFVLSGFLIAYTYAEKPTKDFSSYRSYILLRMARILPLYWILLTAYYVDPSFGQLKFDWKTYSLFHGFSNVHNLDGISQAWSLNVEMSFYFLAPFLFLLQKKHWICLLGAMIILFVIAWAIGMIWANLNKNPDNYFYPIDFILRSTFPGRSMEFMAGMILATYLNKVYDAGNRKSVTFTWFGFLGILFTLYFIGLFQKDIFHHGIDHPVGLMIHHLVLPVFICLALLGLIREKSLLQRILSTRLLVFMGNASFAFYLCHISYVNHNLQKIYLGPDRNFVLLWILSSLLYLFIEKPIYQLLRRAVGLQKQL